MRILLSLLAASLLAAPAPVLAQLYKWLDADGVVNYGDLPPPNAKNVQAVGPASLSVVPGVPKEQMAAMRERDEQRRQAALKLEADEARARASAGARAAGGIPSELQSYEEYAYDYDYGPFFGYGPPRVRRPGANRPRPHPPIAKPTPPVQPMPLGEPSILLGR